MVVQAPLHSFGFMQNIKINFGNRFQVGGDINVHLLWQTTMNLHKASVVFYVVLKAFFQ